MTSAPLKLELIAETLGKLARKPRTSTPEESDILGATFEEPKHLRRAELLVRTGKIIAEC